MSRVREREEHPLDSFGCDRFGENGNSSPEKTFLGILLASQRQAKFYSETGHGSRDRSAPVEALFFFRAPEHVSCGPLAFPPEPESSNARARLGGEELFGRMSE